MVGNYRQQQVYLLPEQLDDVELMDFYLFYPTEMTDDIIIPFSTSVVNISNPSVLCFPSRVLSEVISPPVGCWVT